jgi:hypothetical protein
MREFYTAWRLVFGAGGWDRVLCFDVRLGTMALALARSCLHLSIVGFDPNMVHAAAVRLRSAGASNFDCNVLDPDGGQLPFPNEHFDAVVAEDLGATLVPDGISERHSLLRLPKAPQLSSSSPRVQRSLSFTVVLLATHPSVTC